MGERKVLNKYIPADFDPKLVPRGTKPKDDLVTVRMMLPFTIQCTTCSTVSLVFFSVALPLTIIVLFDGRPSPPTLCISPRRRLLTSVPASVSPPHSLLSRSCHIAIYHDARAHAVPVPG